MTWLAGSDGEDRTIIAAYGKTIDEAMSYAVEKLLKTPYDIKYSNVGLYNHPNTKEEWIELERKLLVSNGEYAEYTGWPNTIGENVRKYCQEKIANYDH